MEDIFLECGFEKKALRFMTKSKNLSCYKKRAVQHEVYFTYWTALCKKF